MRRTLTAALAVTTAALTGCNGQSLSETAGNLKNDATALAIAQIEKRCEQSITTAQQAAAATGTKATDAAGSLIESLLASTDPQTREIAEGVAASLADSDLAKQAGSQAGKAGSTAATELELDKRKQQAHDLAVAACVSQLTRKAGLS